MPLTLGDHYLQAQARIDALVRDLDAAAWDTPVPACPGWRARDVIAHLYGIVEDGAAGRLRGIPGPELTAEQVERHRDTPVADLLGSWAEAAPLMAAALEQSQRWPGVMDVVTHEHDLRTALGRPGARDHESIAVLAGLLADGLVAARPEVGLVVDGRTVGTGGTVLTTSSFEVFRSRLGRRTRAEVVAGDWSSPPPDELLDAWFVFGPTPTSIGE